MDNTVTTIAEKVSKKEIRQLVYNKLADALVEFKPLIKRKKFDNKISKATKLFAEDIIKASRKGRIKNKKVSEPEVEQENDEDMDD
jgi:hypothetical protein